MPQGEIVEDLLDPEAPVQMGNPPPFLGRQSRIPVSQKSSNDPAARQIPNQIPIHDRPSDENRLPSRVPKPSRAQVESSEYLRREEAAKNQGKDWVNDNIVPLLMDLDDEDPEDIIALKASELTDIPDRHDQWVPNNYYEAITRPKLWGPPMDEEIRRMEERDVWEVVLREPWMKTIDTRWVYDKKIDGLLQNY